MRLGGRLKEVEEALVEREEKVDHLDRLVRTNENVINWLNKQLNAFKTAETNLGELRGSVQYYFP